MRLVFLTRSLNLWSGGGSNYSLHLTLSELHRKGVDVELLVLTVGGLRAPDDLPYPVTELGWSTGNRFGIIRKVRRLLEERADRSDIFHLYGPPLMYGGGAYRSRGGSVPVVVTLNDYQPLCSNIDLMDGVCHRTCTVSKLLLHSGRPLPRTMLRIPIELYLRSRRRKYTQSIDQLLPDSDVLRTVYAEAGFDMARSTVISEMIDYERLRTIGGDRRRRGASNGRDWHLAYVGRLIRAKGVDLLLDAVAGLEPRVRLHLHIAGDGPEREALQRQVGQLGLTDRVTFHGWLLQGQLWSIYERADLFVHPGRWPEPFGRTIIEAMTLGLPTVVSEVGHPPTLVRDVGLTFRAGDSDDLAQAIATAIHDYDRLASAAHGARGRAAQFSPVATVARLEEVYHAVLGGNVPET